jgi:hypothetical protein
MFSNHFSAPSFTPYLEIRILFLIKEANMLFHQTCWSPYSLTDKDKLSMVASSQIVNVHLARAN